MRGLTLTLLLMVLPYQLEAITATNHDKKMKPPPIAIEDEEILQTASSNSSDLGSGERQRRLIPYMTFYLTRNFNRPNAPQNDEQPRYQLVPQKIPIYQNKYVVANYQQPKYIDPASVLYQPKITYTPFLETNKLPGGFSPMRAPQPIRVQVLNSPPKEPNYSTIFDKLLHLKQIQKPPQYIQQEPQYQNTKPSIATQYFTRNYATPRPPTKFITVQNYQPETRYKINPPAKTFIHTYTPATIDISNDNKVQNYENFESLKTYNQIPTPLIEPEPVKTYQNYEETSSEKENYEPVKYENYQTNNEETQTYEPVSYQTYRTPTEEPKKYEPVVFRPIYRPPPVKAYRPIYQQEMTQVPQTENPNSLSLILKQLQQSNTLPHTLTPDNIDNSIKTLVQILNALKQTEKFQRPIVVAQTEDTSEPETEDDYEDDVGPSSVSQEYPANTPEGGTPGKPGIDYPAYSLIPQTDFSCKKQRYKGFFGDPATSCQVWHYCDLNGGQASFLCPNGTIFSQVALTCDWWYNVKCATTTQLYVLNERLYKYILPFTPKFPEDYSGPLVDRYLALKFAEMEEKMKKQKKSKTETPTDDAQAEADANKLEDIQSETESASVEHTTASSEEEINK